MSLKVEVEGAVCPNTGAACEFMERCQEEATTLQGAMAMSRGEVGEDVGAAAVITCFRERERAFIDLTWARDYQEIAQNLQQIQHLQALAGIAPADRFEVPAI